MNSFPFAVDKKTKLSLLKGLDKNEEHLEECVECIKSWVASQPHLPEVPSDKMIEFFIFTTKFDIEAAQKTIDNYYTLRSSLTRVFQYANPSSHAMKAAVDCAYIVPLPNLVNDRNGVVVIRELPNVPSGFDGHWWLGAVMNVYEVRMQEGAHTTGNILLYDHQHLSMKHVFHVTPAFVMNLVKLAEQIFDSNFIEWHFINSPPIVEVILKVLKAFMKPELYNRLRYHHTLDTLPDYIPLEVLPKDYGGNERSLEELRELYLKKLEEHQPYFDRLETLKVDEARRPRSENAPTGMQAMFNNINSLLFG
ncbi:alpha-tocopherol transfer protein-like [Diabrotica virgifera virgifera]|uniref:Alpha-tocopherol transfer protein-like n=1 Tax=Diabrotica virgifera virgifera TaxID=50390 RepID=A0A6P7G2H7_DIAVI|nr:alpha-tocopherol transfer protein-like [Diabrotica virgifera virgifera]